MRKIIFKLGRISHILSFLKIRYDMIFRTFYSGYCSFRFKEFGGRTIVEPYMLGLVGAEYISIGDDCYIDRLVQISAWDNYKGQIFTPEIRIGNNCGIGAYSHITAINGIYIGNNVRTGKGILITDNAHGASDRALLDLSPRERPLVSKGKVIIEDNVWLGEKCSIMPGVTIGRGTIIAAGAVVTHDIPPYCVAGGNPAKIIKNLDS